eukprot:570219-Amphidinium_carterae.1
MWRPGIPRHMVWCVRNTSMKVLQWVIDPPSSRVTDGHWNQPSSVSNSARAPISVPDSVQQEPHQLDQVELSAC